MLRWFLKKTEALTNLLFPFFSNPLCEYQPRVEQTFNSVNSRNIRALLTKKYLFPLLAFVVPLLLRAIPEILMGPYVVGFDTMGYYVPTTLQWLGSISDLWQFFASAPLFYAIVDFFVYLGAPLIGVLKVVPVLLHGFLGLSIYVYAKHGLDWSPKKSVLTALIGTVYFVALRVSWDLLRNELALIFFFLVLTLLSKEEHKPCSWKNYALISLVMMAVVLAHQLVSVILIGMLAVILVLRLRKKDYFNSALLLIASLPAILFFGIVYFSPSVGANSIDFSTNFGWPLSDFNSYPLMLMNEAGFFLYCYLPLLPLALISWRSFRNLHMRSWLFVSFVLLLIPIVSLSNYRWVLMFTYPLAFYVVDTVTKIKPISWRRLRLTTRRIVCAYLTLTVFMLSLAFIIQTPEAPFSYYRADQLNGYIYQIPSSMLQNTISVTDCKDTDNALQWYKINIGENASLLAHRAFYGWALQNLDKDKIALYEFHDPVNAAKNITSAGHQVFLIWWTRGSGWYGLPSVNSSFQEIYHSGRIAIYNYTAQTID